MIRFFAAHPTASNLLMLAMITIGLIGLPSIRRETFPDFAANEVEVRVVYRGATAEEVETEICIRIEEAIDEVNAVHEVRSEASEGVGTVTIEMVEGGGDFVLFLDDVKTAVEGIDDFPDDADDPIIRKLGTTDRVASIAVTGDMPVTDLKAYCEDLRDRLQQDAGISLVRLRGFSDRQFQIRIPRHFLIAHRMSVQDVADVLEARSFDLPVGAIESAERDITIRFVGQLRSGQAIEDLVLLSTADGAEIRLGDVATVTETFERAEDKIHFNGQRAGILEVTKTKQEDSLTILAAMKEFLDREQELKPPGVELVLTENYSSVVEDRIEMVVRNGWQGLILVLLVMALFFSPRFSFWVAAGLPVSFLAAFFVIPLIGYSINMLTLIGLLLGIGLLMDDSIVIAENVASHLARGKAPVQAAIDGVEEVKVGVLSSFGTTLCIFGPISFIRGDIGKVLHVMPVVLIIVLAVSLLEAFLILPHHLAHSARKSDPTRPGVFRRAFDRAFAAFTENVLGRLVDLAVRFRYVVIGATLAALLISVGQIAGGRLKFQAFPDLDGDVLMAQILLPQGTPLARTERVVKRLTAALDTVDEEFSAVQPEGRRLVQNLRIQFGSNLEAGESGPHVAIVIVDLIPADGRVGRVDDYLSSWREAVGDIPDVLSVTYGEPSYGPAGRPIDVRVRGDDLEEMKSVALGIERHLAGYDGVSSLSTDLRPGKPERRIELRDEAGAVGLTATSLAIQLQAALRGRTATDFQIEAESYEVEVRLAEGDRDSLGDLEEFLVTLPDGTQAPIETVARIHPGRGYSRIDRFNGLRSIRVKGEIDPALANTNEVLARLRSDHLDAVEAAHPDLRIAFEGEIEESETTGRSMIRGLLIGVVGIFILLSFQFRSYIEPFVVMAAIPTTLLGVIWGHVLMGHDLSMPSMIGMVSLAGIAVNDSILLIEFARNEIQSGRSIRAGVCLAARQRFRAVLLTSLTTIAGLLPLMSETSLQAQILIPLTISIVFGLVASTFMVLIAIPCLYSILGDVRLVRPGSSAHA